MPPLQDPLSIVPFTRPVRGEVTLPGSKSITNRALLLAALCDGPVTLTGALFSEDTQIMAEALRKLGFTVKENADKRTIQVEGLGGRIPAKKAKIDVGLAGTAARFLTALCATSDEGEYEFDGTPQMRKRPMKGLLAALSVLGSEILFRGEKGFLPLTIRARGLKGGSVEIDASESSQMLSALLMIAPFARAPLKIQSVGSLRQPFVKITERLMADFGGKPIIDQGSGRCQISRGIYHSPGSYAIEPDATAATYFMSLPMVAKGSVSLPGLHTRGATRSIQGDIRFAEILESLGCAVSDGGSGTKIEYQGIHAKRTGAKSEARDFNQFSDTFLTLAAISPLLEGPTRITGIAHTRKQETDRVGNMAKELKRLGQEVEETEDSLTIHPRPLKPDQIIETYSDHRFAMSFAILGCHNLHKNGRPWLSIKDPSCCAKTFPDFFEVLDKIRKESHSAP
jgi:3-phosphoshikimate 1-carboxyvinyltransferase